MFSHNNSDGLKRVTKYNFKGDCVNFDKYNLSCDRLLKHIIETICSYCLRTGEKEVEIF